MPKKDRGWALGNVEIRFNALDNAAGCATVPQVDLGRRMACLQKNAVESLEQILCGAQLICSPAYGDRPFRVGPQCQARYSNIGGFLLNAAATR